MRYCVYVIVFTYSFIKIAFTGVFFGNNVIHVGPHGGAVYRVVISERYRFQRAACGDMCAMTATQIVVCHYFNKVTQCQPCGRNAFPVLSLLVIVMHIYSSAIAELSKVIPS